MSKLIGCILIMLGTTGIICSQWQDKVKRLDKMKKLFVFFVSTEYAVEKDGVGMPVYLERIALEDKGVLSQTLFKVVELLQERTYESGEKTWKKACEEYEAQWGLGQEAWNCLLEFGDAVFGIYKDENIRRLELLIRRWETVMAKEEEKRKQMQKITIPVEAVCGIMLCVILI